MAKLGKQHKGKNKKGKDAGAAGKGKGKASASDKALAEKLKRLEEADLMKKQAAAAKMELTERMAREKQYTKWNLMKIQNTWRKIMRLAKVESLRKDIEIISQTHERDVDRKDAIIQMLDRDLEEAEEQYQIALRSHLVNIDRLIDIQDKRLLALEHEFDADLTILRDEFRKETEQIEKQHHAEKTELLHIILAVEAEEADKMTEAKTDHDQACEMIRNKNLEAIHVLQNFLDATIQELERAFENAHLNYLTNTDQRTQEFKGLTKKNKKYKKLHEVGVSEIEQQQLQLDSWRKKLRSHTTECERRNKSLQDEKEAITLHYQGLKTRINRYRDAQSRRLTALSKQARAVNKELTSKMLLAERILQHAEMCRRLETEREKILPFYRSSVEPSVQEEAEAKAKEHIGTLQAELGETSKPSELEKEEPTLATQPTALTAEGKPVTEFLALDNFFKRYNTVLTDKLSLDMERGRLESENEELQAILKQYYEGVSVSDDVLSKDNPLFVVNGKVSLNTGPMVGMGAPADITVVEATHMVATRRVR